MREPSDPVQPVRPLLPIESVLELPWLAPGADSLAQLAYPASSEAWSQVRNDPALVLMLLRPPAHTWQPERPLAVTDQKDWFANLLSHLETKPIGILDTNQLHTQQVLHLARCCAEVCHGLALKHRIAAPNRAWVAGLLSPLGWLALGAATPNLLAAALRPLATGETWSDRQTQQWGIRHGSLVRRLGRAWQLPDWLTVLLTASGIQDKKLESLGADPKLWHLLRVSMDLVRETVQDIGLVHPDEGLASLRCLGWTPASIDIRWIRDLSQQAAQNPCQLSNPFHQPFLKQVLTLAGENRRLRDAPRYHRLEDEIDQLHEALEAQQQASALQLHKDKLEAMAEFAAGAGHEINNPLAVVSGQAQYLLTHETTWFTPEAQPQVRKSLQTVIAQTRRMHSILRDVMLFARPATPTPTWGDLPGLMAEVASAHQEMACQKGVQLDLRLGMDRLEVRIDAEQVRQALACLLQNAIEAAPTNGWARLVLHNPGPDAPIDVHVEDSGPGPDPAQRDHLFDPFFSGRNAGRGRGLGLSIAWRLARLQGGDVWLARSEPGQPTRFVLRLPVRERQVAPISQAA